MWIGLSELVIHSLRSNVFLPEKSAENQFTLAGELKLMFAQVLLQRFHFFRMLLCHDRPPLDHIKDETAQLVKGS